MGVLRYSTVDFSPGEGFLLEDEPLREWGGSEGVGRAEKRGMGWAG